MKILIAGASSRLAQAIVAELDADHELRLMDSVPVDGGGNFEFMQGSLLNRDDLQQAVRGVDALIHTGEPPVTPPIPPLGGGGEEGYGLEREQMLLNLATRGTHNLFSAGVAAGIKKFIYAGTLGMFGAYPDDVYISELWKPLPSPEIIEMTKYLGELTCREFARDHAVTVTCLRLGALVLEEEVKGSAPNLMWLDLRDAASAFRCALRLDHSNQVWWARRWAIYHICADIPNPKFLIDNAARMGYKPTHNFQAQ